MNRPSPLASLLTVASILAVPAATFAQEGWPDEEASRAESPELPTNVRHMLEGKQVTLNTQAVGPIELQLVEEGLFKVRLTYKQKKMVGQGTFLELDGKGGHNVLHVALYREDELARLEQQLQAEEARQGAAHALGLGTAHEQLRQQLPVVARPVEMKITILDEALVLCESPTILGNAIRIGGDAAKAVAGLFVISADYLRHLFVDKVWRDFLVDTLAKRVIRDLVAKQFFRDLVAKKIFRDIIWRKVIVEFLGERVFRDAIGKAFFRDIIWRKGILGPAKWFAREFFDTTKPGETVDATVEVIGEGEDCEEQLERDLEQEQLERDLEQEQREREHLEQEQREQEEGLPLPKDLRPPQRTGAS